MRIVHTADWHIGKSLNDYSLLKDQQYYFEQFADLLKNEIRPDALIIAGDIYDRSVPSSEAVTLLNDILYQIVTILKIETFIVAGNHDSKERLSFGSSLLERSGLHIAGQLSDSPMKVSFKNANFFLVPYLEPHNLRQSHPNAILKTHNDAVMEYTKTIRGLLNTEEYNILIGHGLYGAGGADAEETSVGGSEMIDASAFKAFDYVALGHLHNHRTAGAPYILFSGSPLKYSIDEASQEKSFIILDIPDKKSDIAISVSKMQVAPLRDVRVVTGEFDSLMETANSSSCGDYIFFELTDKQVILNAISRLKSVFPYALGLKYINLERRSSGTAIAKKSKLSEKTPLSLFYDFYTEATGESLTAEQSEYLSSLFNSPQTPDAYEVTL